MTESVYKPEYAEQAYKLCILSATNADLASFFGVPSSTIMSWLATRPEFREKVLDGRDYADSKVASRLYNRAIGYDYDEQVHASYQGKITDVKTIRKHCPPDPVSCIFWLKNRQPDKWKDKRTDELTGPNGEHFKVKIEVVD